jgi:hypothetical protein
MQSSKEEGTMFHLQTKTLGARDWETVLTSEAPDGRTRLYAAMDRYKNLLDSRVHSKYTTPPRDWRVVDDEHLDERIPFHQREASWPIVLLALILFIGSFVVFWMITR